MGATGLILLSNGDGEDVRNAATWALGSGCRPVVVVTPDAAVTLAAALEGLSVEVVSSGGARGMGALVRAGVEALQRHGADGAILARAEQRQVTTETLETLLLAQQASKKPVVASRYADTVGTPAYFARTYFHKLQRLLPQQDCTGLILGNRPDALLLGCPEAGPS